MNPGRIWQISRWYVACVADRMTWQHVATTGLFALWTALFIAIDLPLRNETQQIADQLARDATREPDPAHRAVPHRAPDLTQEFIGSLPDFEKCTAQLRELNVIADQSGVVLASINYRYERVSDLAMTKVTLGVDALGDAPNQRRFLQATLNALPNLAIARLVYTKAADGPNPVKLKLDLNMYFQSRARDAA